MIIIQFDDQQVYKNTSSQIQCIVYCGVVPEPIMYPKAIEVNDPIMELSFGFFSSFFDLLECDEETLTSL